MKPPAVHVLPWDSDFFGFTVARIAGAGPGGRGLGEAVAGCRAAGVRCAYLLCGIEESATLVEAVRCGFRPVDVRVTLRARLASSSSGPSGARDAREGDLPDLRSLARSSFRDSRFFVDGKFATTKAEDLFQIWVERDFQSGSVVVAEHEGRVAGFATARVDEGEGVIGLVSVSPARRGLGVGRTVVSALLAKLADRVERARVVTQARNPGAIGLYEGLGFRTASLETWLHWWADENPV